MKYDLDIYISQKFQMPQFHGLKARLCRPLQAEPHHDGWPLLSQQISGSVFTQRLLCFWVTAVSPNLPPIHSGFCSV